MILDTIHFTDGTSENCFNLSGSVGMKGENQFEDVMLIQAMLRLIAMFSREAAGLQDPEYQIPEVTGEMDADTHTAIGQFQIAHKSELMMKVFDGRIDPANYYHRKLRRSHFPVMTITLLHMLATDAALMLGSSFNHDVTYQGMLEGLNAQLRTIFLNALIDI